MSVTMRTKRIPRRPAGALALVGVAGLGWSLLPAHPAQAGPSLADPVRDEFRSQMILPLALGADSGRRMGATAAVRPLARAPERPTLDLVATLTAGESLTSALTRAGVARADASQARALIAGTVDPSAIAPGTVVDVTLGRRPAADAPRPLEGLRLRVRLDLELELARSGGTLALTRRPIAVDATPLRITGTVGEGLYRSARAAGAPASAIQQYLQTLDRFGEGDLRPGDAFDIVVSQRRAETGEREAGSLLYAGVERLGKPVAQLVRWGGRFHEASDVGERQSGLLAPVPGSISSHYGMRRHPILGYRRMHGGTDFRAAWGTPIVAVADARVSQAGWRGGFGRFVRLEHGEGLATGYAHMSSIAVSPGQAVRRGEVIGFVGSTGLSTGPHLHYEMYRHGARIDPRSVRWVTRALLEGGELARFRAEHERLTALTPGAALANLAPRAARVEAPRREIDRLAR